MVLVFLTVLVITAMSLYDILSRDPELVRFAPKAVWLILVLLLPLIGPGLWFLLGRRPDPAEQRTVVVRETPARPPAAPATPAAPPAPPAPHRTGGRLSTEEQLAALEREIEEDRIARRIAELEVELRRRRGDDGEPA
ncbi:PLDc N-terminal domain-containing protein [Leifsonia aquatica]|uniref:Cardiolipin synthase N-terminal domain-containing protein n=3 Tax=Leifsonia aquatica TaxID=144185 RepID=A0A7W4UZZ6_LEIAQ|nr:PLDc N-terminal domain-containing protein [Leifsonia aquatica]MBB2969420.1 hypothetical protein [Leifsonia aquatica]